MLIQLKKTDSYLKLVLLHIVLGGLFFVFKPYSKLFFLVITAYFFFKIIKSKPSKLTINVLLGCAYFSGFEILFRMTKGSIAYESSKYIVTVFVLMGVFRRGVSKNAYAYFIYIILLIPSILVAATTLSLDAKFRSNITFVLSGPICLGLVALFCYERKISFKQIHKIILYVLLPIISTTIYLFLYTPSIKEKLNGTASNAALSGGFGPNQVSTILGLGIFCVIVRLILRSPSFLLKLVNITILIAMVFRAIITFSRGGVIAAIIVIIIFFASFSLRLKLKRVLLLLFSVFLLSNIVLVTWLFSSSQTSGLIDKRYANQDALGREKSDLTTGRLQLFLEEMDGFLEHPFIGVGASRIKDKRYQETGLKLPSHNEIGRLLSEHGFLGVLCLLILVLKPLVLRTNIRSNIFFFAFLAFWFATINHSGIRIAAPALFYGLALLNITYEKPVVHWKQLRYK